jgi:adenylate kinase
VRRQVALLGPPGSGKGTQGARLSEYYGVPLVGSGDLIRDHIARQTPFGKKVEAGIAAGNFAPDADILYWMRRRLSEPDAQNGYLLDGFPRDLAQAAEFDRELGELAAGITAIELLVPEDVLIDRLAARLVCGGCARTYNAVRRRPKVDGICDFDGVRLERRPEDDADTVPHRLAIYRDVTAAVAGYYGKSGRLMTVDGDADEETVFARLKQAIEADRT